MTVFVGLYKLSVSVHPTVRIHPQNSQYQYPHTIAIMDALKAEIALKRKSVGTGVGSRPTKYMRRGDIERIKQEEEQKVKQERARDVQEEAQNKAEAIATEQGKPDANVSILPRVVLTLLTYEWKEPTSVDFPHTCG
jgi:hypothetical protein